MNRNKLHFFKTAPVLLLSAALLLTACGTDRNASFNMKSSDLGGIGTGDTDAEYADEGYADEGSEPSVETAESNGSSGSAESIDKSKAKKQNDQTKKLTAEKIVYTGSVSIETLDFEKSKDKLRASIKKYEGIIQNESENNDNENWYTDPGDSIKHFSTTVRIPSQRYRDFMATMGDVGNVTSSTSDAQNITTEYYDTQARIKSLKTELKRLRKLLEKANSLNDIMAIEDRISNVEYELDSAQSRLSSMDLDVAYSTVTIYLSEVSRYTTTPTTFFEKIGDAFIGSGRLFVQFIQGALILIIYAAPILAVICLVGFGVFKLLRKMRIKLGGRRRRKKALKAPAESGEPQPPAPTMGSITQFPDTDKHDGDDSK